MKPTNVASDAITSLDERVRSFVIRSRGLANAMYDAAYVLLKHDHAVQMRLKAEQALEEARR